MLLCEAKKHCDSIWLINIHREALYSNNKSRIAAVVFAMFCAIFVRGLILLNSQHMQTISVKVFSRAL